MIPDNTLYKYLPPDRIDVLQNNCIRISQLGALNDFYDGLVSIESRIENQDRAKVLADDHTIERFYSRRMREDFDQQIGVISLSADPANILLWSHYSKNNSGYVLHFNHESDFFQRKLIWTSGLGVKYEYSGLPYPSEVNYSRTKAKYYIEDGVPFDVLFQKSSHWEYEHEFRSLMNLSDGVLSEHTIKWEHPVYLTQIPDNTICGITIGIATSQTDRETIYDIAKTRNIPLYKIVINHLNFELKQIPVDSRGDL